MESTQAGRRVRCFRLSIPRAPSSDASEVGRGPLDSAQGQFKEINITSNGSRFDYKVSYEGVITDSQIVVLVLYIKSLR